MVEKSKAALTTFKSCSVIVVEAVFKYKLKREKKSVAIMFEDQFRSFSLQEKDAIESHMTGLFGF